MAVPVWRRCDDTPMSPPRDPNRTQWPDERLDALARAVEHLTPLVATVAALSVQMGNLTRVIEDDQKDRRQARANQVTDRRNRRSQIIAGVTASLIGALVGGLFLLVISGRI